MRDLHPTRTGDGRSDAVTDAPTARRSRPRHCSLAVTLAAVLGMARLFDGGGWLGPLAANAVAAHLAAAALRRRGLSLPVAAVLMAIGAAIVVTWTSYWSTTTAGPAHRRHLVGDARSTSATRGSLYQDVVAPAPVARGFVAGELPRALADRLRGRLGRLPAVGALRGHPPGQHPVPVHRAARRAAQGAAGRWRCTRRRSSPSCSCTAWPGRTAAAHWVADRRVARQPLAAHGGRRAGRRGRAGGHAHRTGASRAPAPPACSTHARSGATTRGSR